MHFVKNNPEQKRKDFDKKLKSGQLYKLNIEIKNSILKRNKKKGIF